MTSQDAVCLECAVCLLVYHVTRRPPRVLPCGHTFCLPCLARLTQAAHTYSCPMCRTPHQARLEYQEDIRVVNELRRLKSVSEEQDLTLNSGTNRKEVNYSKLSTRNKVGKQGSSVAEFWHPWGIAFHAVSENVLVTDYCNHRVQVFNCDFQYVFSFGSEGSGPGQLRYPAGLTINSQGQVIIADQHNHRIQVFTADGKSLYAFGQKGSAPGSFNHPVGVACDEMNAIYVCDSRNHRVQVFDESGGFIRYFGGRAGAGGAFTGLPAHVAVWDHRVYVTEGTSLLHVYSTDEEYSTSVNMQQLTGEDHHLNGLTVDKTGKLLLTTEEGQLIVCHTDSKSFEGQGESSGPMLDQCVPIDAQAPQCVCLVADGDTMVTVVTGWTEHCIHMYGSE